MNATARQVRLLAEVLDQQGRVDAPIVVIGSRAHLRPEFPARTRGGPLVCGTHELRLVKREKKPGELQSWDWIGDSDAGL